MRKCEFWGKMTFFIQKSPKIGDRRKNIIYVTYNENQSQILNFNLHIKDRLLFLGGEKGNFLLNLCNLQ